MLGDETWILLTGDHAQMHERRRAHELRGCDNASSSQQGHTRTLVACVRHLQDSHERWDGFRLPSSDRGGLCVIATRRALGWKKTKAGFLRMVISVTAHSSLGRCDALHSINAR